MITIRAAGGACDAESNVNQGFSLADTVSLMRYGGDRGVRNPGRETGIMTCNGSTSAAEEKKTLIIHQCSKNIQAMKRYVIGPQHYVVYTSAPRVTSKATFSPFSLFVSRDLKKLSLYRDFRRCGCLHS